MHALILIAWLVGLIPVAVLAGEDAGSQTTTESFRREHAQVTVHLAHVRRWAGELRYQSPTEQGATMARIVSFFDEEIRLHAAWEERALYPLVDRLAGSGAHRFTQSMRYEHGIIGRWIDELARDRSKDRPSVESFIRRTDNLLGLLEAHFEAEEQVLLPLIDQALTPEQFHGEIWGAAQHP